MKIFITGGTGFIGKHVVEKLREDKNNELFLLSKNLADIKIWKKEVKDFNPDAIIHLAWEGLPDHGTKISMKNLKYGLDLLVLSAEIGCKVFLSTGSCYEYGLKPGEMSEGRQPKSIDAFAVAKNCLCQLGMEIAKEHNTRFIWARLFYVYGPGQRELSILPYLIQCAKNKKTPEIKNPSAKNDFVYIQDVADALCLLLQKSAKTGVYNIGSGHLTAILNTIETVSDYFGVQNTYNDIGSKATGLLPSDFYADISKIKKDTGWEPKVDIQEGIKKTIGYYENGK